MHCFGWTWEYVDDHMTLPRLAAIKKYQANNTPAAFTLSSIENLLAQYMGAELKTRSDGGSNSSTGNSRNSGEGLDEEGKSVFDAFPQFQRR